MAELTPRMKELVQPYLAGIEPYDPNFTPTRINLSANENTYPVPAGVREAVDAALAATPLNRYPDPMSNDLRDELAAWHGVARENVCVGNGGDELLYNYLLAFGGAGRTLLNCPPCFSEYAFFASLCQTEVRDVWRDPATFELDQAAVLAAASECNLAIVTSPNNPTGDVAPLDFVAALCDACPGMVMVDEAYVEFADDSFGAVTTAQGLIAEHPNLVILHTLSKAFGAAGTRLGYVIAAPPPSPNSPSRPSRPCAPTARTGRRAAWRRRSSTRPPAHPLALPPEALCPRLAIWQCTPRPPQRSPEPRSSWSRSWSSGEVAAIKSSWQPHRERGET